jgi:hypothetical protein
VISSFIVSYSFTAKYLKQRRATTSANAGASSLNSLSVLPVLMFCLSGFVQSLINLIALLSEHAYPKCAGNAEFNRASAMCYVQSVSIMGAYVWSECWAVVIAMETWTALFRRTYVPLMQKLRKWYIPIILVITVAATTPLHVNSEMVGEVCLKD